MKIKCANCGKTVDDSYEFCPHCGSVLTKEKKETKTSPTPQTINELKAWYKSKNLPPENVTRFYIGKNYKAPRAFGIYQDGDEFIVYKNKGNGSRTIRYKGTDEAYAVNELYLRLKDEIKNQKKNNKNKKTTSTKKIVRIFVGIFIAIFIGDLAISGVAIYKSHQRDKENALKPQHGYYYRTNDFYYCVSTYLDEFEWWKYSEGKNDYYLYATKGWDKNNPQDSFVDSLNNEDINEYFVSYIYDQIDTKGMDIETFTDKYNINKSHTYIDAGHHYSPYKNSYYVKNGKQYYYLDNYSYSGDYNYDGWYTYDNGYWTYYCDDDDMYLYDKELWYDYDSYYVGDTYNEYIENNEEIMQFEDTNYYNIYLMDKEETDRRREEDRKEREESSFWDSYDSDSSWDSSDSWDSDSTDWDSDW